MALIVADRVQETTNSTGTGAYTLGGAVPGFQTFASEVSNTDTVYYSITDNVNFEVGLGTYASSGGTITRTAVFTSSNSNNAVNWGIGTKNIFLTYPADKAVLEDASNNVTIGNNLVVGGTVDGRDVAADGTKLDYISVTQAVNLDQMETDIAALANGMVYKGDWNAGSGSFPGGGAAQTGWFYYVSGAGTVNGISFAVGDNIVATTDNASASTYANNWSKHDQTDAVQSVVGLTGTISKSGLLSALNVEDGANVTDAGNVNPLVDSHINVSGASNGQYLGWNGSDYAWSAVDLSSKLSLSGGTMSGDINGNGNKVLFANVYATEGDLPSASTYHGMFAHVHATGKGYYAHAGNWIVLANETTTLALSGGAMTGAITTNSTFDGRDVATDGSKLDSIESGADQTDTANVTAAGALMDSEVDADIKTLSLPANTTISAYGKTLVDDADAAAARTTLGLGTAATTAATAYATAAQGTKADAALPKAGGALTGAVTTNSTFDGRDVATDGSKLDGIASGATNVTNNNQLTNGAGYTTNVGDITGVTAGSGISGGGTSGTVTVSHADTSSQASLTALTGAAVVSDIDLDTYGHVTNLATRNITLANLGYTGATNANNITNNNQLTNGAGYTTNTGDITGVTAGTNLNGGGSSGGVTLNLDSTITVTTVNAGTVNTTSDERAKEDITPITGALDKVQQLGGYSFTLKATDEKSSGVIAQEVQKVMPELVQEGAEGLLSVQYGNMVGLLIEAIKEQQAQIDELKQKLNG